MNKIAIVFMSIVMLSGCASSLSAVENSFADRGKHELQFSERGKDGDVLSDRGIVSSLADRK